MGKSSLDKGKRGEREVVAAFEAAGFSARRGWQARSGSDAPDIVVDELPSFWIEVKRAVRVNIHAAMRQAMAALAKRPGIPIVISRNDGQVHLVTMRFDDWLMMLAAHPYRRSMTNVRRLNELRGVHEEIKNSAAETAALRTELGLDQEEPDDAA